MLELQREGAPEERVQKAQEGRGGGVVGAKTAGARVAISFTSLAAVAVNSRSNVKDGYYEEWQLDSGTKEHVTLDGTSRG